MDQIKQCRICGTIGKIWNGLCVKHYMQIRKHGQILETTRFDQNQYVIHNDFVEILLRNKGSQTIAKAKIDIEDVAKAKQCHWYLSNGRIFATGSNIPLSRLVLDITDPKIHITYKDKDYLNCSKSNLRAGTISQRSANKRNSKNNTSGHKGVSWSKKSNKWYAYIQVDGKTKNLGNYGLLEDAVKARQAAEEKYFGEFAYDVTRDVTLTQEDTNAPTRD